jgi:hypothetical protein
VFAGSPIAYPATNLTPSVESFLSEFVNAADGDYRLKPTSRYRGAGTDGADLGASLQ